MAHQQNGNGAYLQYPRQSQIYRDTKHLKHPPPKSHHSPTSTSHPRTHYTHNHSPSALSPSIKLPGRHHRASPFTHNQPYTHSFPSPTSLKHINAQSADGISAKEHKPSRLKYIIAKAVQKHKDNGCKETVKYAPGPDRVLFSHKYQDQNVYHDPECRSLPGSASHEERHRRGHALSRAEYLIAFANASQPIPHYEPPTAEEWQRIYGQDRVE